MMEKRILIVDDEVNIRNSLSGMLSDEGYLCTTAADGEEALERMHSEEVHLVITDLVMPNVDGLELLQEIRREYQDVRVILLTAHGTIDSAVQAMKYGAVDFLLKPVDFEALLVKVQECFKEIELRRELESLKLRCQEENCAECLRLVGESTAWKEVLRQGERLAESDITVLITGESGTGKELVARMIHRRSPHHQEPFIAVNCGGLPETLLESELFGVVKGAYSGAARDRTGLIRSAKKGTLFLDEISELSLSSQAKLLRVLQDGEIRPLGSDRTERALCRFIAATNRDLQEEVRAGRFREDLYYRISSYVLSIPPLRDRWEDIAPLAHQFIVCHCRREGLPVPMVTSDVISLLQSYEWPGNVRQLENVLRGALLFHQRDTLTADDFPPEIFDAALRRDGTSLKNNLNRFERSYILRVLKEHKGDKRAAAAHLKISLTTLYQKIKDLNIPIPNHSGNPD